MVQKFILISLLLLSVCFSQDSFAMDSDYMFGYSVVKDNRKAQLEVTVTSIENDRVLGVTLYPVGVKDIAKESASYLFVIKKGTETVKIPIDTKFKNGTFEAALWTKKIPKSECQQTDILCQKFGFKAGGYSVSYTWGYLLYAP
ncbi:MAG: hypothetical protein QMD07_05360 [Thermodesulfovibrionales bacterium]|nr:hypothetical protein [Thermodesulfovibrionales bacterium]